MQTIFDLLNQYGTAFYVLLFAWWRINKIEGLRA